MPAETQLRMLHALPRSYAHADFPCRLRNTGKTRELQANDEARDSDSLKDRNPDHREDGYRPRLPTSSTGPLIQNRLCSHLKDI
jgi:hypothetical protein